MRIRSFVIAYALVLAILLFADRRPNPGRHDRYSRVVDLTDGQNATGPNAIGSQTRIIAPGALIPGTWAAGQIPPERLVAPLVIMDLNVAPPAQISLDDIAAWETQHGSVPQGSVVAVRRPNHQGTTSTSEFPLSAEAAKFLMDARYTAGFATESRADFGSDLTVARQIALHGNYIVEGATRLGGIPATGSLVIVAPAIVAPANVAPANDKNARTPRVRVLAMVQ